MCRNHQQTNQLTNLQEKKIQMENQNVTWGYARVSTTCQNLNMQVSALQTAGCLTQHIRMETASGALRERKELERLLSDGTMRAGDTLVIWKLDRLARNTRHLLEITETLSKQGIHFRSITEKIDTITPGGKFFFVIMAGMSEFERDIIRERTRTGIAAAKERGRVGGRPEKLKSDKKKMAIDLYNRNENTAQEIATLVGVSRKTLYSYIKRSTTSSMRQHRKTAY